MADHRHCLSVGGKLERSCEETYGVTNPVFENNADTWKTEELSFSNGTVTSPTLSKITADVEKQCNESDTEQWHSEKQTEAGGTNTEVVTEVTERHLIYKISDSPPFYLTMFFALQQSLLSIAGALILPLLVAEAVCADNDDVFIRKMFSSTILMCGFTTFMQTFLGIRLPLYQGPSGGYIVPLIALRNIDDKRCSVEDMFNDTMANQTALETTTEADLQQELISLRTRELMGPLILCGVLHCLIGLTGLVGIFMRFIGPITIVPTILLVALYIVKPAMKYAGSHWGITAITWSVGVILSLYLGHKPLPIPAYTRRKGFHIIRYPIHQVFAILISILVGWTVSAIMTNCGALTSNKESPQYKARTDAREDIIEKSDWFYVPYPGQFGSPLFSYSALIGFLIATFISILDSIGDYYAAAKMCRVPPPPRHAINRGIAIEGFCSMLSGCYGTGHATTTYGGNIGAIGMTKVASRQVFIVTAVIYMVLAVLAKVSAVFISIPYPVLGGTIMTIIGVFVGVNLSNLGVVDLASTRNLSIIGMAVFAGRLIPEWVEQNKGVIQTGNGDLDQVLTILLGNPNFFGAVLACALDNTVPGSDEERGITAWRKLETSDNEKSSQAFTEGYEVYEPILPRMLKTHKYMKYCPIFPSYKDL